MLRPRRADKEGIPEWWNSPRGESAVHQMGVPKVPGCTPDPVYQLRIGTLASQREDRWHPSVRRTGRWTEVALV